MKQLNGENVKKCMSLLKEFIDQSMTGDGQKRIAVLALEQLQKINAGSGDTDKDNSVILGFDPLCYGRPRADG